MANMIDIVFPRGNEKELLITAKTLGYKGIVFTYLPQDMILFERLDKSIKEDKDVCVYLGVLMPPKKLVSGNIFDIRKKADLIIVESSEYDRQILESKKADVIYDFENQHRQDFLHHRNSGLNHILAKLAQDSDTYLALSLSSILSGSVAKKTLRSRTIGRMMQNINLAKKFKLNIVFASFAKSPFGMRSPHDLISLAKTIGMDSGDATLSLSNAQKKIALARKRKDKNYLADGVEVVE